MLHSRSNLLSQSVGVKGSMFTVCASGGSTCNETETFSPARLASATHQGKKGKNRNPNQRTFIPSLNPNNRPKVPSTSTLGTSCSCLGPARRVCERMPVQPRKTDCCLPGLPSLPVACLKLSSTTTFCTTAFELRSTLTSEEGRLSKQFLRLGRRATSAWEEAGGLRAVEAMV